MKGGLFLVIVIALGAVFLFLSPSKTTTTVVEEKVSHQVQTLSDWPQFRGSSLAHGVAKGSFPDQPKLLWKTKVGDNMVSSPSIKGDRVFIGSGDDKVYALNRKTGEVLWDFTTEDVVEATPLVLDGRVYIGSADYFFYCLDEETGKELWRLETDGKVLGSANWTEVNGEKVIIMGSYDGYLYSITAATGNVNWQYDSENYVNGTPLVDEGHVYFGGCDEQLHGVDVATGKGSFTYALDAPVPGTASKHDQTLYVGTHGGRFLAYDLKAQKITWEISEADDGFYSTAAVDENNLILAGRDKLIRNLDPKTGEERWSVNLRSAMDSSPIIIGERVLVGTKGGKCVMLNLKTGEKVWEYDVGAQIVGALSFANDVLFVSVKNGNLYAFGSGDD